MRNWDVVIDTGTVNSDGGRLWFKQARELLPIYRFRFILQVVYMTGGIYKLVKKKFLWEYSYIDIYYQ